ncbi:MAG: PEP-CTERM system histidine kinase PrsK [candidate division Zixibacteria bacterium]|nr:PEP-CTERM system histidine kinase PrsK [candidate division Zixibacteria bacterium]
MFSFNQIIIGIALLVLLGCELWALKKSARGRSRNAFLLLNLSFALILSGYLWLSLTNAPAQTHPGFYLLVCGLVFTPSLWVLFSYTLAREDSKAELKKGILTFIPFLFLSLVFILWQIKSGLILVQSYVLTNPEFYFADRSELFLIFILAGAVVSIISLEKTFHSCIQEEKRKLVLPFVLSLALLVLLVYLVTSGFLDARIRGFTFPGWGILSLLWSLSLIRYLKEKTASVQITRQVVYSSAVAILIGGYLILIGLVAKLIQSYGANLSVFLSMLAAFLVIVVLSALVVSSSVKERVKRFVDSTVYKGRVDYQAEWTRFSENIASLLDLDEILKEVAGVVSSNLRIEDIAILLSEGQGRFSLAYPKDTSLELVIRKEEDFLDWIFRYGEPIGIKDIELNKSLTEEERVFLKQAEELKLALCVPMIAKRNLVGLLFLGQKKGNQPFSEEDFSFLGGVAHQASIAVLNAKLSQELILSREMESFNKLSSFILHDLKNFISMLSMLLQNAEERLKNPDFQKSVLVTISDTVERMKNLISKLSTPSAGIKLDLKNCDLNKVVQNILDKMKISNFTRIKTSLDFGSLPLVRCDQTQIEKVFQNLILNALEAMPEGGTLSITTEMDNETGLIRLKVSDTGSGMSKEFIRNSLFKPFQTTKKKGLGIGLIQCKEIMEMHKGRISVESEEGKGTIFTLELPL